jgi:hypothetical protein
MSERNKNVKTSGQRIALATPRVNVVPTTPKNVSSRASIREAIRRGAERQKNPAT